jgi:hypothetical protein
VDPKDLVQASLTWSAAHRVPNIRNLTIECHYKCSPPSSAQVDRFLMLCPWIRLESLNIDAVSEAVIPHLAAIPHLRRLSLSYNQIISPHLRRAHTTTLKRSSSSQRFNSLSKNCAFFRVGSPASRLSSSTSPPPVGLFSCAVRRLGERRTAQGNRESLQFRYALTFDDFGQLVQIQ